MWTITEVESTIAPSNKSAHLHTIKSRAFDPTKFKASPTTEIRLLDDDGDIVFTGEMSIADLNDVEAVAFAPLDWAQADSGCTTLQYKENGTWETL